MEFQEWWISIVIEQLYLYLESIFYAGHSVEQRKYSLLTRKNWTTTKHFGKNTAKWPKINSLRIFSISKDHFGRSVPTCNNILCLIMVSILSSHTFRTKLYESCARDLDLPKSAIFRVHVSLTRIFDGFISRWIYVSKTKLYFSDKPIIKCVLQFQYDE